MALSDTGTDVKDRKEPVPRDFLRVFPEAVQRTVLNWFGGQDRMLGEIVSGVNRNRQNIVQLETDYQAADGALSTAYIAADAVVAADAASARATLSTTLTAAYQAADTATLGSAQTYADAAVSTEASARASADSAIASDVTTLEARVTTNEGDISTNAAAITTEATARASGDSANATLINTLSASIGGTGVNLLPLEYTRFDGSIPTVVESSEITAAYFADANVSGAGCIAVYDAGVSGSLFKYIGLHTAVDDYNIRVTPGKTYIISAYFQSNIAKTLGIRVRRNSDGAYVWAGSSTQVYSSGDAGTWVRFSGTFTADSSDKICILLYGNRDRTTPAAYVCQWAGIMIEEQVGVGDGTEPSPWSEGNADTLSASVSVMQQAFVDAATGEAYASFDVEAAAGAFSAMLRLYAGDGSSSIGLFAEQLFLGSNTVFEDTYNTFYSTSASKRLRMMGPFGSSSDLVMWYGPTSVALNSETKTNGYFAMGTNGKVYIGSSAQGLSGATASASQSSVVTGASPQVTSSVTVTPQGGDGTYTYAWTLVSGSSNFTVTSSTSASTTFSTSADNTLGEEAIYRCTVTETSTGKKASVDVGVLAIYIPPP